VRHTKEGAKQCNTAHCIGWPLQQPLPLPRKTAAAHAGNQGVLWQIKHVENMLTIQFQTLNIAKTYRKRYNKSNPVSF
jgi:hypothetical protein